LILTATVVSSSSGQITLTSISSPTDLPRILRKRYSISNVGNGGAGHYIWWNKYNSGSVADGGGCGANNQVGAGIPAGNAGGASGGAGGPVGFAAQSAPSNGGGGGGGGASSGLPPFTDYFSGAGGSGIVLIKYEGPVKGQGGEIYTTGSYTVHAFTSSGIFTV
jgi:hypothetical protein